MATGSGKTFTAVQFCLPSDQVPGAKRILFLGYRKTLGAGQVQNFKIIRRLMMGESLQIYIMSNI